MLWDSMSQVIENLCDKDDFEKIIMEYWGRRDDEIKNVCDNFLIDHVVTIIMGYCP
jgi:hypothetical protein